MAVVIKTTFLHLCEIGETYNAKSTGFDGRQRCSTNNGKGGRRRFCTAPMMDWRYVPVFACLFSACSAGVASDLDIGVVRCAGVEQVGKQFLGGDDC